MTMWLRFRLSGTRAPNASQPPPTASTSYFPSAKVTRSA
ncbi:hypothetical protein URH17368_2450 [Alicyclobacillus hesperidum URH17-3-68]|nr:hypothetical protein URH17368_2450 [Alicyclobacillus hesperidum URH17-3-68]